MCRAESSAILTVMSTIILKCMHLPTNHITLPILWHSLLTLRISVSFNWGMLLILLLLCSSRINTIIDIHLFKKLYSIKASRLYTHFSLSESCCHIYLLPCISLYPSAEQFYSLWCRSLLHLNGFHNYAVWLANLVCNYWRLLCCRLL